MDPIEQCGNNLQFIINLLRHPHVFTADSLKQLAEVSGGLVNVLVSAQITNPALAREFRAESAKALLVSTNKFASNSTTVAA